MAERIIPIQLEGEESLILPKSESKNPETSKIENISCSMEELNVECDSNLEKYDKFEAINESSSIMNKLELQSSDKDIEEHIILVIDRAQDENYTPFTIGTEQISPHEMLKKVISIFIKLKLSLNPKNEFSIIVMNKNQAELITNFTNNSKKLLEHLAHINPCETEDIFNLNTVFDIIANNLKIPSKFLVRTILFYGRSYTIPQLKLTEQLEKLFKNPYFLCDVLITHETAAASNNCQKIFDILKNLESKEYGYFLPVERDSKRIYKLNGRLLGHPFQRPLQKLIN